MSSDFGLFVWVVVGVFVGVLVAVLVAPINNAGLSKGNVVSSVVVEPGFHCMFKPSLLDYSTLNFSGFDYCVKRPFDSEYVNGTRYYFLK